VFGNVRESSGDLTAVVRAYYLNGRGPEPLMAPSRLNLVAPRSRAEVAKAIAARGEPTDLDAPTWGQIIEYCCGRAYVAWERGEPFVDLTTVALAPWDKRELVKGFVPRNDPVTLFSDGGGGKSTVAAALALSVLTGKEIVPGLPPLESGPILYLDWESNKDEHGHRLHRMAQHLGLTLPERFVYRRNYRAFADDLATFRREVARSQPILTVVDSAVPASGDDVKETGAAKYLFNGLRSLSESMASIVLAHMSKAEAERDSGRARVMGTVMYENLSRSVWEGRPSTEAAENTLVSGWYHRKFNGGRRRSPFAIQVVYDDDDLPRGFERVDIRDYPDLDERRPTRDRLTEFLGRSKRSTKEIADFLGMEVDKARRMLKNRRDVLQLSQGGGRNNDAIWGLCVLHEATDTAATTGAAVGEDRWWDG
jgi:hypothetical protein